MPIDALGIVMIIHGEEFGEDSPFGNSLVTLGRAHCKVAKLQEAFAQSFHDSFMASLVRFAEDIKDYEALRKKLESRRLSYDAATAKNEKMKSSKKEKERKEAEEEFQRSKSRYEETEEEVEAHMHAIQENEIVQLRELTSFLTLELNFAEQYVEVLKETRANWPSDPPTEARGSLACQERRLEDEGASSRPSSRPPSRSSRPPSRPASRASRPRSDSAGTAGGDKDKRRLSVAGWATSAVGSVTGRSKKSKDKEFASLTDEGDSGHGESDNANGGVLSGTLHSITRRKSGSTNPGGGSGIGGGSTPKLPTRILKPPSQVPRKVVKALYDFSGSSDELAFKAGDTIVVVNEVLDGWWMGELNGKQGLFPTPYTEVVADRPPLPSRAGRSDYSDDSRDMYNDDDEDDQDSDANEHYGRPVTAASPFYGGASDAASIVSSVADEDDDGRNLISPSVNRMAPTLASASAPPPMGRRSTTSELLNAGAQSKKAPPPPPPRRSTNGGSMNASPMIPERRPPSRGTMSSSSGSLSRGHDRSPFDSATELTTTTSPVGPSENGCTEFKQNPFKPKGMCSNCFEFHG
ncbi:hypothetical protein B0H12DRAFT_1242428 [Mycena haematopus]|nr:hypothetical protein B0H12DRAFT_1242428 [Mycena haematopus]